MQSWSEYFELSKNNSPSPLLESAIPLAPGREKALDLGAGSLKDSKFLLSMGFRKVVAIDQDKLFKNYAKGFPATLLQLKVANLEELKLPKTQFDLINASYSLPFTQPPHLPEVCRQIIAALKPGGIFCGQFFGPKDGWNTPENQLTFTSQQEIEKLLSPLKIIHLEEVNNPKAKTIDGQPKHWHIFHIIAQKSKTSKK